MTLRLVAPIHRATHRIGLYLAARGVDRFSQGEAHILALLAAAPRATVGDLHRGLAHKRSTLTSILDRLEGRALVTRAVGVADRRTFVVSLTRRGRLAAARVQRQLSELERGVAGAVTDADVKAFARVTAAVEAEALRLTRAAPRRRTPARAPAR